MKPLFNSLGSNYTFEFAWTALGGFLWPITSGLYDAQHVKNILEERFDGDVELVYKGRDAIELALRVVKSRIEQKTKSEQKKLAVLTQGLACHAIEEGIIRAGMVPVYVDLEMGTLSPSPSGLKAAFKKATAEDLEVCAVFLQHTLGYANPVPEVRDWCDEKKIILIEDLAQSFGAKDSAGVELGTTADIVICSFGRDKVIDAVSGGAVIVKRSFGQNLADVAQEMLGAEDYPPVGQVRKELLYPLLTWLVRNTHQIGIGKVLFQICRKLKLFTSPILSPTEFPTLLPSAYAPLALWQLKYLDEQLEHRRVIAKIYIEGLKNLSQLQLLVHEKTIEKDIHLRVPVLCNSPELLQHILQTCTQKNIHLTDRWYRTVVDSGSLNLSSVYKSGECPVAEDVSSRLLNLPTHRQISVEDAQWIVNVIREVITQY